MNTQPAEAKTKDDSLDVQSLFFTIQGEGPFAGYRAIFVRLAGCNLQCMNCDTDYTTNRFNVRPQLIVNEINRMTAEDIGCSNSDMLVVITGGEPFRQAALKPLVSMLLMDGFVVQLETNGTIYQALPYEHENLHVVCSPKTEKIHKTMTPHIGYYKFVGDHTNLSELDGLPTTQLGDPNTPAILHRPPADAIVYLSPVDHGMINDSGYAQEAVVESCLKHGHILCLQIHKIIGVQ